MLKLTLVAALVWSLTSSQSCAEKSGSCLLNMTVKCANMLVMSLKLYLHHNQNKDKHGGPPTKTGLKQFKAQTHTSLKHTNQHVLTHPPAKAVLVPLLNHQPSTLRPSGLSSVLNQAEVWPSGLLHCLFSKSQWRIRPEPSSNHNVSVAQREKNRLLGAPLVRL